MHAATAQHAALAAQGARSCTRAVPGCSARAVPPLRCVARSQGPAVAACTTTQSAPATGTGAGRAVTAATPVHLVDD